jgi:hypothetical protein
MPPPNPMAPAPAPPGPPEPHPADNLRGPALDDAAKALGLDTNDQASRQLVTTALAGPLLFQVETDIAQAYSEPERERAKRGDWSGALDHRLEVAALELAVAARMVQKGCEAAGFPVPPRAQKAASALDGFLAKEEAPAPAHAPAPNEALRAAHKGPAGQSRSQPENPV